MWRVRNLIGGRISSALALVFFSILAAISEAGILAITAQVATSLVNGRTHLHIGLGPVSIHTTIGTLLLVAMVLALARFALQIPVAYYPAVIAGDVQANLRKQLFRAFTAASWDLQSKDREGHLQELMTNQITFASNGALQATALVTSLFTLLVLAISAFALNVVAAVTVLGAAIVLFGVLRPLTSAGARTSRALSAAQMQYAGAVGEANSVAEEAHVFGTATAQRTRMDAFIAAARKLYVRTQLLARAAPGIYQSMIYIVLVLGLIALNQEHVGSFSSLGAVVLLLVRAGSYGQQVQSCYQFIRQSLPYIERLQDATDRYLESEPAAGDTPLGTVKTLAFDHVGYSYRAGRPVLSEISYQVAGGETIGVVGPSGAGKSTMVQLLLRLRAPESGQYLINGVPTQEYSREDWSRRVVYVPQQPRLIHATVADNVRFLRDDIDDEAVERACRQARIHDEIMSWSDGYQTIVGPRADAVSGGQQQRICLARSLAAEPDVLVLDEPTSALDPRSEALIQESLIALKESLTLFIIAHRMTTLTICDRVMVILDGQLDAFDTLEALRSSNQYYQLASSPSLDNWTS